MRSENKPSKQPEALSGRHIQEARIELADFVSDLPMLVSEGWPEGEVWDQINHQIRLDNFDLSQYVTEMLHSTTDPEARRLIASTAFVVYTAMWKALDPERKIEKQGC